MAWFREIIVSSQTRDIKTMRQFFSAILLLISTFALGQNLTVRDVSISNSDPVVEKTVPIRPFVETIFQAGDEHYYDNQDIIIRPSFSSLNYEYVAGFTTVSGDVYKGQIADASKVLHYDRITANEEVLSQGVLFTPSSELEGHKFTIKSIERKSVKVQRHHDGWSDWFYGKVICIKLVDEDGVDVIFSCKWNDDGRLPFLLVSYFEKYNKMIGQEYFLKQDAKDYSLARATSDGAFHSITEPVIFSEIGFIKDEPEIPYIFFTDKAGVEFFYPLYIDSNSNYHTFRLPGGEMELRLSYLISKQEIDAKARAEKEAKKKAEAMLAETIAEQEAIMERGRQEAIQRNLQRRTRLITKYGEELGSVIASGNLRMGMSKEQCIDAIGKPIDVQKTTNVTGVHEHWFYAKSSKYKYVYFLNDKITSFQE